MDWNSSLRPCDSRALESSSGLLYNYNLDQFPVMEMKQSGQFAEELGDDERVLVGGMDQKKKRLSKEQLECLERSFAEEIKLDPHRKMKLSKELGLRPRQIAVWFQNRRARWKAKQLQHLYDALKQDFDTISNQKHKLQQEVIKLRSMLGELGMNNQVVTDCTDVSGEGTVESTSMAAVRSTNSYIYNVEDFSKISEAPFWSGAQSQLFSFP